MDSLIKLYGRRRLSIESRKAEINHPNLEDYYVEGERWPYDIQQNPVGHRNCTKRKKTFEKFIK